MSGTRGPQSGNTVLGGVAWTTLARAVSVAATAGVGIVLTRTLPREQIGVLTLALVVAALTEATTSVGLSRHLVQRPTLSDDDIVTAFWGDVGFTLVGAVILVLLSPWVADFYGSEQLLPLLLALSLAVLLTGFIKTQRNLAFRDMRFGVVAQSDVLSALGSAALAVVLLLWGAGIWAVIWREVSRRALLVITLWWRVGWRPSLRFSVPSFRESFGFGSRLLGVEIMRQLSANFDQLIVGGAFGTAVVGVYSRGQALVLMPMRQLTDVIGTVLFPTFSRMTDTQKLADAYREAAEMVFLITVPAIVVMGVLAEDGVVLVLGERWREAALYLRILSISLLWRTHSELIRNVFNALGRTDITLKTTLGAQLIVVCGIGVGYFGGPAGIAVGHLLGCVAGNVMEQSVAAKLLPVRWGLLLRRLVATVGIGVLAASAGISLLFLLPLGWLRLLLGGAIVPMVFVVGCQVSSLAAWKRLVYRLAPSTA